MIGILVSLISGVLFAVGLVISGMTDYQKIIGFLDIFGSWDYSLLWVMGGAVGVNFFTFKLITQTAKPKWGKQLFLPTKTVVDKKLIIGSSLFGIGWGLAGICPGPGIVNLVTLRWEAFVFVLSMSIGMMLFKYTQKFWR